MKAARHVAQLAQRYGRRELCRFAQPQCKGFWQTRKILKELVALEPGYSAESPPQSTGSECVQACHRGASDDATHRHLRFSGVLAFGSSGFRTFSDGRKQQIGRAHV